MINILIPITLHPLSSTYPIVCPSCSAIQARYVADNYENLGGKKLYQDGDCIGGFWQELSTEQTTPNAFDSELLVGKCHSCHEYYYSVCMSFINHHEVFEDVTHDIYDSDVGSYLLFNKVMPPPKICIAKQTDSRKFPRNWLVKIYETPYGQMYHHDLGLMKSNDYAKRFALRTFDSLKAVNQKNLIIENE